MRIKKYIVMLWLAGYSWSLAAPLRVALLDFESAVSLKPEERIGGAIDMEQLSQKGIYLMGKRLLEDANFVLVDRRDFIREIEKPRLSETGRKMVERPSFIHAAQALRVDVVLRGKLLNFSEGKRLINQGGYKTDFSTLSSRVVLEALDATDGTVISMADGTARKEFRLTEEEQTTLSEDDALNLVEDALASATKEIRRALHDYMTRQENRSKVKITVTSTEDPALVEIDGVLVGSTPLEAFEIYQGDHVLTVGRAGYRDVSKRILFEKDTRIEVPLFRAELTAEETKEILEESRIHAFVGAEPALVIETIEDLE